MTQPVTAADPVTAEDGTLKFMRSLVTTLKPELVVEMGVFLGVSTLSIAAGLKQNGFGRVISCEPDEVVFAKARENIEASTLAAWIDLRNESSLEMKIDGRIDLFFSNSELPIRDQEIRRYLPQINPFGVILIHDAGIRLKTVPETVLKMEAEGLLSVVRLPASHGSAPRGLMLAQKRQGRV